MIFYECKGGKRQTENNLLECMNKIKIGYGLLSLLSLVTGMVIYLLFRDLDNVVFFTWILKPSSFETTLAPLESSIFTDILKYNLPDMLWFVSAILFFRYIWFFNVKVQTVYIMSTSKNLIERLDFRVKYYINVRNMLSILSF